MFHLIKNLIVLGVLSAILYAFRVPLKSVWNAGYERLLPCRSPLSYSIEAFDMRFGISKEGFLKAIRQAESRWEKPIERDLFAYVVEGGDLEINLVYDYRQEATEKLETLGLKVNDDRESYEALEARYRSLKKRYALEKAAYEARVSELEAKNEVHNREVQYWNKRKGAPPAEYERIKEEERLLNAEVAMLREKEAGLAELVSEINALVTVINRVAGNINANADVFNEIGRARGEEFTEGLFTSDASGRRIAIFQFDDTPKLVRVLMHEFGHALSLDHVDDPKAIMYRLNQGTNTDLSQSDIAALKAHCRIE